MLHRSRVLRFNHSPSSIRCEPELLRRRWILSKSFPTHALRNLRHFLQLFSVLLSLSMITCVRGYLPILAPRPRSPLLRYMKFMFFMEMD